MAESVHFTTKRPQKLANNAYFLGNFLSPVFVREDIMGFELSRLHKKLESNILARTGRRIRGLDIQLLPEGIVLYGQATTYYVKQLAQHSIRELLPDVRLQNAIVVS